MADPNQSKERWELDAERLIYLVARLIEDRDQLQHKLAAAYGNLDRANERIDQLAALNSVLNIELREALGQKPRRRWVGTVAAMLAVTLTPVVTGFQEDVGAELHQRILGARDKAVEVAAACDVDIEIYVQQDLMVDDVMIEHTTQHVTVTPDTARAVAGVPGASTQSSTTPRPGATVPGPQTLPGEGSFPGNGGENVAPDTAAESAEEPGNDPEEPDAG